MSTVNNTSEKSLVSALQYALIAACSVPLALYAASLAWPLHLWGVNYIAYIPPYLAALAFLLPLAASWALHKYGHKVPTLSERQFRGASALIAVGFGILFYQYYIQTVLYGDSKIILRFLGKGGPYENTYSLLTAFSPDIFTSKNGEQFAYSLAAGTAKLTGWDIWMSFRVLASVFGAVYVFVWLEFVRHKLKTATYQLMATIIGLTAGITQVFYSYVEVYAPPVLFFTAYLMVVSLHLEKKERRWAIAMPILLLLSIRSHSAGFLLVPSYVYVLVHAWAGDDAGRQRWLSWKRLGGWIPLGALVIGTLGYLTVFEAGDEQVDPVKGLGKNIFLRLAPDGTPDNEYHIFTPWHIWDYFQEMILWSAPAFALLLVFCVYIARKGLWNKPSEIAITISFLLLFALFFAVDPILTMPRDWDLCGLVAPALLLLIVLFLARIETVFKPNWLHLSLLLLLAGLQLTFIPLNIDRRQIHTRLIDMATHTYITKHGGAGYIIRHAVNSGVFDSEERIDLLTKTIKAWDPHTTKYNLPELSFLCQVLATEHADVQHWALSAEYFTKALDGLPKNSLIHEDLAKDYFHLQQYDKAYEAAMGAVRLKSTHSAAWKMAFECAMKTGQRATAVQVGSDYLRYFGDPEGIRADIEAAIQQADTNSVDSLQMAPK